jgi:hypothetical protein
MGDVGASVRAEFCDCWHQRQVFIRQYRSKNRANDFIKSIKQPFEHIVPFGSKGNSPPDSKVF